MIIAADGIDHDEVIDADVCIVGAGPAGLSLADELLGGPHRVVVLESGSKVPDESETDLTGGEVVGYPYHPLHESRIRAVGGTWHGWHEYFRTRPLDPVDFEPRPWVPGSGWPLSPADLDPCFDRATRLLDLGGPGWGPEASPAHAGRTPLADGEDLDEVVFRYSNTVDYFAHRHRIEGSANVILVESATALEIDVDDGDTAVRGVVASMGGAHRFRVPARAVVVAAGGIESARLLMLGADGAGIGEGREHLGRYFMEHPRVRIGVVRGPDHESLRFFDRLEGDDGVVRGAVVPTVTAMRRHGLLNGMALVTAMPRWEASEELRSLGAVGAALEGHAGAESVAGHLLALGRHPIAAIRAGHHHRHPSPEEEEVHMLSFTVEQPPRPASRIVLGDRLDRFGQPMVRLHWQVGDEERRTVRFMGEAIDRALRAAGVGRLDGLLGDEHPQRVFFGEWHHIGTTRMSANPAEGVVDADLGVHGLDNLFVLGSSVFPTSGYANPTLTIVALALRLAGRLEERLASGPSLGALW